MIGVDANVLLRLLFVDEPAQNARACAFFESRISGNPAFVSAITLAETVWALKKPLAYSDTSIHQALSSLKAMEGLVFEHETELVLELDSQAPFQSGIADQIVTWSCMRAGCSKIVTFDKRAAARVPGMELLT